MPILNYKDINDPNQKSKTTENGKELPQISTKFTSRDANNVKAVVEKAPYKQLQLNVDFVYTGETNPNDLPEAYQIFNDDDAGYTNLYGITIRENGNILGNARACVKLITQDAVGATDTFIMVVDMYDESKPTELPRNGVLTWNLATKSATFEQKGNYVDGLIVTTDQATGERTFIFSEPDNTSNFEISLTDNKISSMKMNAKGSTFEVASDANGKFDIKSTDLTINGKPIGSGGDEWVLKQYDDDGKVSDYSYEIGIAIEAGKSAFYNLDINRSNGPTNILSYDSLHKVINVVTSEGKIINIYGYSVSVSSPLSIEERI